MRWRLASICLAALPVLAQQGPITIRATWVLDGRGGVLRNHAVVIQDGRILRVEPSTAPPCRTTVMPGWIDTHVHISWHFDANDRLVTGREAPKEALAHAIKNAYATLKGGFTTVQSLGAPIDAELRRLIDTDKNSGPRLITSLGSINENTGTPAQIRAFVRQQVKQGADVIKLFATKSIRDGGAKSMSDEQIAAACGEALSLGKRSVVHAHASEGARAAVLAGCTTIEHGAFLDDDVLQLMATRGTYFDPNFLVLHNYLENRMKFLGIGNYNEAGFAAMEEAVPRMSDVLRRAIRQRVKVVFGTDAVAGAHGRNAEEFIYRVRDAGQDPMDAFISATSRAAESLGLADRIGTIAPGMAADLVLVSGNPLEDITAVRSASVIKNGYSYPAGVCGGTDHTKLGGSY